MMSPKVLLLAFVWLLLSGVLGAQESDLLDEYFAIVGQTASPTKMPKNSDINTSLSRGLRQLAPASEQEAGQVGHAPPSLVGNPLNQAPHRLDRSELHQRRRTWAPHANGQTDRNPAALRERGAGEGTAPIHGGFTAYHRHVRDAEPNVRIGPADISFSAHLALESSDNFFHTRYDHHDSLSLTLGSIAAGSWQVTDNQAIEFQVGIGMDYWFDAPNETDGSRRTGDVDFHLTPGSVIDYSIQIGRTISVRLYDKFEIRRNQGRYQFTLDAVNNSDQWMNAAGTTVTWEMNDYLNLEAGYEHGKREAFDREFSRIDYHWHSGSLRATYAEGDAFQFGLEASTSKSDYRSKERNDADSYSSGIFALLALSDYTTADATIGFEEWRSEGSNTLPENQHQDVYGSFGVSNLLNDTFQHTFRVGRYSSLSEFSDIIQSSYVRYGFDWNASDATLVSGHLSYQRSREEGSGRGEKADTLSAGISLDQSITDYLSAGLGTDFSSHHSNLLGRDYDEHRAQSWLSWRVSQSLTLTASYEHWRASGDVDFRENRAFIGTNYSF